MGWRAKYAARALCAIGAAGLALAGPRPACAAVLFHESFADVTDWTVIYNDQGGSASLTSDGALGSFSVGAPNNFVAFGPVPSLAAPAPFSPSISAYRYSLYYDVDSLTDSTSYSIEIDQFDASTNYLATMFSVAPQGTLLGSNRIDLTGFAWNPSAAFILPKVTVYTGLGSQTVVFDTLDIEMDVIPEPGSLMLLVMGVLALRRRGRGGLIRSVAGGRGVGS